MNVEGKNRPKVTKNQVFHENKTKCFICLVRKSTQLAKAGRSLHIGCRRRVGGSAHGKLNGLIRGSLLQEIDDILAADAAHVGTVHSDDDIPNAQTCTSSVALRINSLDGKTADVFSELDAVDKLSEIKRHLAIFAILKAELERSEPQRNRLAAVDAHQYVGDLPRSAGRSHLRWRRAEVGLRLHKLRGLSNTDLRLELLLLLLLEGLQLLHLLQGHQLLQLRGLVRLLLLLKLLLLLLLQLLKGLKLLELLLLRSQLLLLLLLLLLLHLGLKLELLELVHQHLLISPSWHVLKLQSGHYRLLERLS